LKCYVVYHLLIIHELIILTKYLMKIIRQNDHLADTRRTSTSPLIYDTRRSISNPM